MLKFEKLIIKKEKTPEPLCNSFLIQYFGAYHSLVIYFCYGVVDKFEVGDSAF
jgi:hypothetical protein